MYAALRDLSAIIVALPPGRRLAPIDRVTEALGGPLGTVHQAVLGTESITAAPRRTTTGPQQAFRSTPLYEDWGVPTILDTSSDLRGCVHARAAEEVQSAVQG